ncbi:hypothetical protein ACFZCY_18650 [Streptomyces sp. NPDC007983]|uniref:hypothetical protein n=1 Tax=Streptomyces sp. NPDC007983 TaxID=3364800 RepID=UPI0036E6C9B6
MLPAQLRRKAEEFIDSDAFFAEPGAMAARATLAVRACLTEVRVPALDDPGCSAPTYGDDEPQGGPLLVGGRVEAPALRV